MSFDANPAGLLPQQSSEEDNVNKFIKKYGRSINAMWEKDDALQRALLGDVMAMVPS